jgi:hypothetical protein
MSLDVPHRFTAGEAEELSLVRVQPIVVAGNLDVEGDSDAPCFFLEQFCEPDPRALPFGSSRLRSQLPEISEYRFKNFNQAAAIWISSGRCRLLQAFQQGDPYG